MSRPTCPSDSTEKRRIYNERYKAKMGEAFLKRHVEEIKRHHAKHREARKARRTLGRAIAKGRIQRSNTCQRCGTGARPTKDGRAYIQAHHYKGYAFRLEVIWLCPPCHKAVEAIAARIEKGETK